MSLSRRDVIIASIGGFIAWGLVVQAFPYLRYIGWAFATGAITAILGVLAIIFTTARPQSSRKATNHPSPSIAFLSSSRWPTATGQFSAGRVYKPLKLYPESPPISKTIDDLLSLALRDFVASWYKSISNSPTFVREVEKGIRSACASILERLVSEDLINVIVSRVVPIVTAHLKDFDQAEKAVRGRSLNRNVTESAELDLAIAAKYKDGKLHSAASMAYSDVKLVQQEYLRKLLVRILPEVLPPTMVNSRAVVVLVKEIVSCAVLWPAVQIMADPDTWNQLMEAYGRVALQDRKTVKKLRAALDEHASPASRSRPTQDFPRLAPGDSERGFERFVRSIRNTNNLSEARRFRSQVASQLKRESLVEVQDQVYIRRLQTGKRVLDQKVSRLASVNGALPGMTKQPDSGNDVATQKKDPTLVEIMHNPSGLSYFMEYMDRQKKMVLVQFWIVVDGFRNPLEDDFGEEPAQDAPSTWSDADQLDIAQINEAYMNKIQLRVGDDAKTAIKMFLRAGRRATLVQYRQARSAILTTQSAVLEELREDHFRGFKKSDLWYNFLATDEAASLKRKSGIFDVQNQPLELTHAASRPHLSRSNSQPNVRHRDLRRAVMSSTDLRSSLEDESTFRKSFDTKRTIDRNAPLFDDDYDTDTLAHSVQSLDHESTNGDQENQGQVIQNMEAALTHIMTDTSKDDSFEQPQSSIFASPTSIPATRSTGFFDSPKSPLDMPRTDPLTGEKIRPSIASLGLVSSAGRIGVFRDNDLFSEDEARFIEDEYADSDEPIVDDIPHEDIHEAQPGDLGLAEAISALTKDIERLVSQESIVDTLTRKAELTNNVAELRILGKSKASLQREIKRKELQRSQYTVQESDNSLYGKAQINIKNVMVGKEQNGDEFALYVIEVQRTAGDQLGAAAWVVMRRYSEFHELYQKLRSRYPATRGLEFPRRKLVLKLQKEFLHKRRTALEAYLRNLLTMPDVCRSRELRSFLSQSAIVPNADSESSDTDTKDIVSRIYNSVTDGMDEFLGNIAVLDQLTVAGQNLISAATTQINTTSGTATAQAEATEGMIPNDPGSIAEAEAELSAFDDREPDLEPFVKPICDLFLETFELDRGTNVSWLRGRAVVVVLHQLLGGTVERKVRDIYRSFTSEASIVRYLELAKDTMWLKSAGDGERKMREAKARTSQEKTLSKRESQIMLATLIPDLAGSVVGRANSQAAARRIHATMNNERLNMHLTFCVLDEIVNVLFPRDGSGRAR